MCESFNLNNTGSTVFPKSMDNSSLPDSEFLTTNTSFSLSSSSWLKPVFEWALLFSDLLASSAAKVCMPLPQFILYLIVHHTLVPNRVGGLSLEISAISSLRMAPELCSLAPLRKVGPVSLCWLEEGILFIPEPQDIKRGSGKSQCSTLETCVRPVHFQGQTRSEIFRW